MNKNLIKEWYEAQKNLDKWKNLESDLRDQVAKEFFDDAKEGTTKIPIDEDVTLVCDQRYNYTLDHDKVPTLLNKLPRGLKNTLVRKKFELVKKVYDIIDVQYKEIFDECLTVKPGKPQIKLVFGKKEKSE